MLHPSYTDLINAVNSEVEPGEQPVVQSRYSIVLATAKRARQIITEDKEKEKHYLASGKETVFKPVKKPLSVAVQELYEGKVKIVSDSEGEEEELAELNRMLSKNAATDTDDAAEPETAKEASEEA